jgi:hypothetical protein
MLEGINPEGYIPVCDAIVDFLLYRCDEDRKFTNASELVQNTGYDHRRIYNSMRWLIAAHEAMAYTTTPGVYEVVDLEKYFDPPAPGVHERWIKSYTR